ncbi:hypothetical protein [Miniphocaeibacter halophilus]|uniref:Uncharacterized protein n=1 Tax=Miniphocaeibacter halophilus TaxID=2931922 RepID=A0AC61MSJ4_9FIRM|nr:hypothetical protein [Miniphocaeibacter halophilus]QQK08496.1 hypothetical protein JFY71_02870 [Miniphocaeibacter halophilus]
MTSPKRIFTILLGLIFIGIGIYYGMLSKIKIKNPKTAKGIIKKIDITINEETKKNNSKFATVEINVKGKTYISDKSIQVSMNNEVGDMVDIVYEKDKPSNMVLKNRKGITIMFILLGIFVIGYEIFIGN